MADQHPFENAGAKMPDAIIPASDGALVDSAAQRLGLDLSELMQRAGAALAAAVRDYQPTGPITVLCGGGNNGGDGYVAAQLLKQWGHPVQTMAISDPRSALCRQAAAACSAAGVEAVSHVMANEPSLLVDAILGAGQRGPLRPQLAAHCADIQASALPLISCDIATGAGQEGGLVPDLVVAMQCRKQENQGCNEQVADLGMPPAAWLEVGPECMADFPLHRRSGHKGSNGRVMVFAGGAFPGACAMAARCALRSGVDLVYAWTTGEANLPATIITCRHDLDQRQPLAPVANEALRDALQPISGLVIGPGLGNSPASHAAARQALSLASALHIPTVIDADGISACRSAIHEWPADAPALIITPHRREAQGLLGSTEVSWPALHQLAAHNRLILCKGSTDFLSDGQQWQYHQGGNPRMSVGGTGDCLAGLCAGLLARHVQPFKAARMALYWLCASADQCWQRMGPCYDPLDMEHQLAPTLRHNLSQWDKWPPSDT